MTIGILGTKLGMTQVFDETRRAIPVTVIQVGPCTVTQVKTVDTDGYKAIQLGYGEAKAKALSKPELGHLAKTNTGPLRHLKEYRLNNPGDYEPGQQIKADLFEVGQIVDVTGTSIGKGFSGYHKRHNFGRGPMSHGSKNHREPGSTGAGTTPGRVYPGKRMAGQMGNCQVTIRKLEVIRVDAERNFILIKGAVPGKPGAIVNIKPATIVGKK